MGHPILGLQLLQKCRDSLVGLLLLLRLGERGNGAVLLLDEQFQPRPLGHGAVGPRISLLCHWHR